MRIRYTLRARADLEEIYGYLERRTPAAAQSLKSQIERQIGWLGRFPLYGAGNRRAERPRTDIVTTPLQNLLRDRRRRGVDSPHSTHTTETGNTPAVRQGLSVRRLAQRLAWRLDDAEIEQAVGAKLLQYIAIALLGQDKDLIFRRSGIRQQCREPGLQYRSPSAVFDRYFNMTCNENSRYLASWSKQDPP